MEKLCNGFGPGSALYTEIKIDKTCENFSVNLQVGKSGDICLHFNPRLGKYFDFKSGGDYFSKVFRFNDKKLILFLLQGVMNNNHVVLNSYHSGTASWAEEEKQPLIIMCNDGTAFR